MLLMLLKVLGAYGIPFLLGYAARGGVQRYLRARDGRVYAELQQEKRVKLLASSSNNELVEELARRDLHDVRKEN